MAFYRVNTYKHNDNTSYYNKLVRLQRFYNISFYYRGFGVGWPQSEVTKFSSHKTLYLTV